MGGYASLMVSACGVAFAASIVAAPADPYSADAPVWAFIAPHYALALMGLFGLAAVPVISDRVLPVNPGLIQWTRSIALLGFALLAVLNVWAAEYEMVAGSVEPNDSAADYEGVRSANLGVFVGSRIEELVARAPHGWLEVAGIGFWMLAISCLSLRGGLLPPSLIGVGVAGGALSFCTSAGAAFDLPELQSFGAFSGIFVVPVWFAWTGFILLARAPAEETVESSVRLSRANENGAATRLPRPRQRLRQPLIRLWPS